MRDYLKLDEIEDVLSEHFNSEQTLRLMKEMMEAADSER